MEIALWRIAIVSLNGFSGLFVVIFLIIPINLVVFFILILYNSVLVKRAILSKKYKLKFLNSFQTYGTYFYIILAFIIMFLICFIYGFILPLFVRNLNFIVF